MNNIKKDTAGSQKVVFDDVLATVPGGVVIHNTVATARFTDGIIPAGTLVVKNGNDFVVLNAALDGSNTTQAKAQGLVLEDTKIEDYTLVSLVISGTARTSALPDKEETGVAFLQAALPRITFY